MDNVYKMSSGLIDKPNSYCPGCQHGLIQKLIVEVLEDLGLLNETIGVFPVGCGTNGMFHMNIDRANTPHGRAPATATGIKRCRPDKIVFSYQGDGDLASIGIAEIVHAANRGENITVIFVNNGIFGMTGGQMAPTTMLGQKATTAQAGRKIDEHGAPIKMCELLNTLDAPKYIERFSTHDYKSIMKLKAGIRKAFSMQMGEGGFAFIEVLSNCPTNLGITPFESLKFIKDECTKIFPLGEFRLSKER